MGLAGIQQADKDRNVQPVTAVPGKANGTARSLEQRGDNDRRGCKGIAGYTSSRNVVPTAYGLSNGQRF
jgi:hypothetical protein